MEMTHCSHRIFPFNWFNWAWYEHNYILIFINSQDTHVNNLGDLFFLQIPSIDVWSNLSVLFQPIGFIPYEGRPFVFMIRIYTTSYGVGRIQLDNVNISALLYLRIAQTDFYYYETQTSNDTHRISSFDSNVKYSVGIEFYSKRNKYNV